MDNFAKAIKAASDLSSREGTDFRVINHHTEFLDGALYVVEFTDKDGKPLNNYVYIKGQEVSVCKNQALLNELVARKSKKFGIAAFLTGIDGVAGIIGILITLTIIFLIIVRPEQGIPNELWAAFTAVFAFYFGSKVQKG